MMIRNIIVATLKPGGMGSWGGKGMLGGKPGGSGNIGCAGT